MRIASAAAGAVGPPRFSLVSGNNTLIHGEEISYHLCGQRPLLFCVFALLMRLWLIATWSSRKIFGTKTSFPSPSLPQLSLAIICGSLYLSRVHIFLKHQAHLSPHLKSTSASPTHGLYNHSAWRSTCFLIQLFAHLFAARNCHLHCYYKYTL